LPIAHNIPFLGNYLAQRWLWTFNLSAGIFGQGIITGPVIPLHMLAGTIVGWAILSPIAKKKEWAPGDVGDWSIGSRGWTLWVALAILLSDCLVNLLGMVFTFEAVRVKISNAATWAQKILYQYTHGIPEGHTLNGRGDISTSTHRSVVGYKHRDYTTTHKLPKLSLEQTYYTLVAAIFASAFLCVGTSKFVFGEQLPVGVILLAVVISLFLGLVSIQAVGQTDHSPVSGLGKTRSPT
jgi:uncharacterized oligopeptide transporter (OPT) family protein